jgi:hypothetical protein
LYFIALLFLLFVSGYSACGNDEGSTIALGAGMDAFIAKPAAALTIVSTIQKLREMMGPEVLWREDDLIDNE